MMMIIGCDVKHTQFIICNVMKVGNVLQLLTKETKNIVQVVG